jgi:hypothetical protein
VRCARVRCGLGTLRRSEACVIPSERSESRNRARPDEGSSRHSRASSFHRATCFTRRRRERRRRRGPLAPAHDPTNQLTALLDRHPPFNPPRPCSVLRISARSAVHERKQQRQPLRQRQQHFTPRRGDAENSFRGRDRCPRAALLSIHNSKARALRSAFSRCWRRGRYRLSSAPLRTAAVVTTSGHDSAPLRENTLRDGACLKARCATEPA